MSIELMRKRLDPVPRRLMPDDIVDQVLTQLIDGDLLDGEALPSERQMAQALGVSRPTVREALQRMEATRVVVVRQGGRTTVRDVHAFGGLDLLPRLLVRRGVLDTGVCQSVLEARLLLGPLVASMAAERADDDLAPKLTEILEAYDGTEDGIRRQVLALEFWDAVVDAAGSTVFRLMFNNLRIAYEPAISALAPILAEETDQSGGYRLLVAALDARDPGAARDAAEGVLRPTTARLMAALENFWIADDRPAT